MSCFPCSMVPTPVLVGRSRFRLRRALVIREIQSDRCRCSLERGWSLERGSSHDGYANRVVISDEAFAQ